MTMLEYYIEVLKWKLGLREELPEKPEEGYDA